MENSAFLEVETDGSLLIIGRSSDGSLQEEDDKTITILNSSTSRESDPDTSDLSIGDNDIIEIANDADPTTLEGLDQLIANELKNLKYVRKMNNSLKKMITVSSSTPSNNQPISGSNSNKPDTAVALKSPQDSWRKMSYFRRRRNQRQNQANNFNMNVQKFIQDYYRSLGTVSRYIILATIFGFTSAFALLSLYSYQIHSYDMERFKVQEEQVLSQQALYHKTQQKHENFRENLIHQKFEETRECHSTLKSCMTNREGLLLQISKSEEEASEGKLKLQDALETIKDLQRKITVLKEANNGLKAKIGQSNNGPTFAQLVVGLLASVVTVFLIFTTIYSK